MPLFKKLGRLFENVVDSAFGKAKAKPKQDRQFKTHKKYGSQPTTAIQPNTSATLENSMAEYNAALTKALADARLEMQQDLHQAAASVPSGVGRDIENLFETYRSELEEEARTRERQIKQWMDNQKRQLDPLTRFIYGELVDVVSSNVMAIQFDNANNLLYIVFKSGAWYVYYGVTASEAESLFFAGSKGGWCWDNLRIRGTVFGHKKKYAFLDYNLGGEYRPKYMGDPTWESEHAAIPETGDIPESWIADKGPYGLQWLVTRNPKLFPRARILSEGVEDVGTFGDALKGDK